MKPLRRRRRVSGDAAGEESLRRARRSASARAAGAASSPRRSPAPRMRAARDRGGALGRRGAARAAHPGRPRHALPRRAARAGWRSTRSRRAARARCARRAPCRRPSSRTPFGAGGADAALIVTASHNEPAYQGVKVLASWGGWVTAEQARRIERLAAALRDPARAAGRAAPCAALDLVTPYLRSARGADRPRRRCAVRGCRWSTTPCTAPARVSCDRALRALGVQVDVLHARAARRASAARAPDPTPRATRRAGARGARARRARARASRPTATPIASPWSTPSGVPLSESDALALLVDHLARGGRVRRGVAISVATGTLVERVAAEHGLAVTRHPIGFKHLSRALRRRGGRRRRRGERRLRLGAASRATRTGSSRALSLRGDRRGEPAGRCARACSSSSAVTAPRLRARRARRERARARARLARSRRRRRTRVGAARVREVDSRRRRAPRPRRRLPDAARVGHRAGAASLRRGARPARARAARFAGGWRLLGEPARADGSRGRRAGCRGKLAKVARPIEDFADGSQRRVLVAVSGRHRRLQGPRAGARAAAGAATRCAASLTRERARSSSTPLVLQTLSGESGAQPSSSIREQEGEIDHIALADWAELVRRGARHREPAREARARPRGRSRLDAAARDARAGARRAGDEREHVAPPGDAGERRDAARARRALRRSRVGRARLRLGGRGAHGGARRDRRARSSRCSAAPTLAGEGVLVTAGGTREPLDPVRVLAQPLLRARWASRSPPRPRGAAPRWCWSAGPSALPTPAGVRRVDVETALEMRDAVLAELPQRDGRDHRPRPSRTSGPRAPRRAQDQEGEPAARRRARARAGAEPRHPRGGRRGERRQRGSSSASPPRRSDLLAAARRKLARKGCDLIVANDVSREDAGFDGDTQRRRVRVAGRRDVEELPLLAKARGRRAAARPHREAARGAS